MYISLSESLAKGFRRWSDAHPPCGNDNDGDVARLDALAATKLSTEYAVMMPPEGPRDPWLVPGAGNAFEPRRKLGHRTPLLWRRRDIYASDDAAAKAAADDLYRVHSAQRTLTNFYLCDSAGRSIYESVGNGPNDALDTAKMESDGR